MRLTQRGQASVTLQPDSGLFNSLGTGVIKLTTIIRPTGLMLTCYTL